MAQRDKMAIGVGKGTEYSALWLIKWLLLGLAVWLFLAIISYKASDNAWSTMGGPSEAVKNWCGIGGAWCADLLLAFCGLAAYFLPLALVMLIFGVQAESAYFSLQFRALAVPLITLSTSALLGSLDDIWQIRMLSMGAGGILGRCIWQGLSAWLGAVGGRCALAWVMLMEIAILASALCSNWTLFFRQYLAGLFSKAAQGACRCLVRVWRMACSGLSYLLKRCFEIGTHWGRKCLIFIANLIERIAARSPVNDNQKDGVFFATQEGEPLEEIDLDEIKIDQEADKLDLTLLEAEKLDEAAQVDMGEESLLELEPEPALPQEDGLDLLADAGSDGQKDWMMGPIQVEETELEELSSAPLAPANDEGLRDLGGFSWQFPSIDLLEHAITKNPSACYSPEELQQLSRMVESKLQDFGIKARVVNALPGPVITRFELDLSPGTKASKITGLARDLARSMSVLSVRVVEVIPGKSVVGLELPNRTREVVRLREILMSEQFNNSKCRLALALGKDIAGEPVVADLTKMPHLLVAGTTGSGKSVCINALLLSLLYKYTPIQMRLILIDPKMLELSVYGGIPHLLAPVIVDMKEVSGVFHWCVAEMEHRYRLMAAFGVRNLAGYNEKIQAALNRGETVANPLWEGEGSLEPKEVGTLPYLVVIADEYADMMMVAGKKIEELIVRLAQKARAAGIHLILATQRPSVDVVTGLIKANIPTRIAFQVSSRIDSRTILDQSGAEQLLGAGDMLYLPIGSGVPTRVHGAFVDDNEVHRVVDQLKSNGRAEYMPLWGSGGDGEGGGDGLAGSGAGMDGGEKDELYDQAADWVIANQRVSVSSLQRKFRIGFNRAARLVDSMESAGLVGPAEGGSGNRRVLVPQRSD